ncbi:MAG: rhodanese-like domain-containing protein [Candidatus Eisenbacteria bacterium]
MRWKHWMWIVVAAPIIGLAAGCSDDDDDAPIQPPVTVDQFDVVRQAFDTYLSSGAAPTIESSTVWSELNDSEDGPFVLSVRSADHFAIGHVPGAVNIPWRSVADPANLATLPTGEKIVAYCYTGHTGQVATTVLSAMGYDVVNMKHGMMAWSKDEDVRVIAPFSDSPQDYPLETTANTLTETYDLPDLDVTDSTDEAVIVREAMADLLADFSPTMNASDLYANIADGNPDNDYFILSVRSAAHYALGHIPGAYNIPWRDIAKTENLQKLPTDQPILVYCYTGHTGQIATTVLAALGYDAVNLKFGMCSWTTDPEIRVAAAFSEDDYADYPVDTGSGK